MDTQPQSGTPAAAQKAIRDLRSRIARLGDDAIDLILREARSHYAWTDRPVPDELLQEIFALTIAGPTSMNTCPARFVFVRSSDAKTRLSKCVSPTNLNKMMTAPVTAIVAWDPLYWQRLDFLFPHDDRRSFFEKNPAHAEQTAFRNATLQGGYFIVAARAMGLDVGAMSGILECGGRRRVLFEIGLEVQLPVQLGLRRRNRAVSETPAFRLRRHLRNHLNGCPQAHPGHLDPGMDGTRVAADQRDSRGR